MDMSPTIYVHQTRGLIAKIAFLATLLHPLIVLPWLWKKPVSSDHKTIWSSAALLPILLVPVMVSATASWSALRNVALAQSLRPSRYGAAMAAGIAEAQAPLLFSLGVFTGMALLCAWRARRLPLGSTVRDRKAAAIVLATLLALIVGEFLFSIAFHRFTTQYDRNVVNGLLLPIAIGLALVAVTIRLASRSALPTSSLSHTDHVKILTFAALVSFALAVGLWKFMKSLEHFAMVWD